MNRTQINSIAASALALASGLVAFVFAPHVEQAPIEVKLVYVLISALGLFCVFSLFEYCVTRYAYRKVLGTWYYRTLPYKDAQHQNSNYAIMEFFIGFDGNLQYRVELYPSYSALKSSNASGSIGTSKSRACRYDSEKKSIHIVFHVEFMSDQAENDRSGKLSLHMINGGHLSGNWTSEVITQEGKAEFKRKISSGRMLAVRKKNLSKLEEWE